MKVIISGATGFIGQEVLLQALAHPSITSIIALSRKPLSETLTSNPKLKVVILDDFENYTPDVMSKLSGAESWIWTIGAKSTDPTVTRKVTVDYMLAAATALAKLVASQSSKLRFIFVSGILAVKDQNSTVLLYGPARKVAGQAELKLVDFEKENKDFETFIARPAVVMAKDRGMIMSAIIGLLPSIKVDQLAVALIGLALNGNEKQTMENRDLVAEGKKLLASRK